MKIAVVDGMGGGIGSQVAARLKSVLREQDTLIALGTNAIATGGMIKSGADTGASGENAIIVTAPTADIIIGPVGIIIPNSLLGEITPAIATAIASCKAVKILVPLAQPHVELVGLEARPLSATLDAVVARVLELLK
jgi:hypothetical protein